MKSAMPASLSIGLIMIELQLNRSLAVTELLASGFLWQACRECVRRDAINAVDDHVHRKDLYGLAPSQW